MLKRAVPPVVRRAFTLVEILVVIGIIALLIAILMPSLNRARSAARRVQCMSNQRQLAHAWLMYVDEFKGYLPLGYPDGSNATDIKFIPWVIGDGRETAYKNATPTAQRSEDWLIRAGSIYKYLRSTKVYRCPEHDPHWGRDEINISYGVNNYLNGQAAPDPKILKMTQVRRSANTYLTIDQMDMYKYPAEEDERTGIVYIDWQLPSPFPTKTGWFIAPPAPRHSGGSCLAFTDGHTEYIRWRQGHIWGSFPNHLSALNTPANAAADMQTLQALRGY